MNNVTVRNSAIAKPPVLKNIEKLNGCARSTSRIASSTNSRSIGNISPEKTMNNPIKLTRKTGSCQNLSNLSTQTSSHNQKSKLADNFYSKTEKCKNESARGVVRSNANNVIGSPLQNASNIPSSNHERYKSSATPNFGNGNIRTATNNSFSTHSTPTSNGSFYNGYSDTKSSKSRIYIKNYHDKSASSGSSSTNLPEASGNTVSNSLNNSECYNATTTSSMGTNTTTHSSFTHSSSSDSCNKYNSDSYFNTTQNRNPLPRSETMKSLNNSLNESCGLVGLVNLGNTCFMNSVLQCLSNCKPLQNYCLSNQHEIDLNVSSKSNGSLIKSYAELMKSIWKSDAESYVSPDKFKKLFQKIAPAFHVTSQQDSQEFLRLMLEGLHQDVNKVRRKSKSTPITEEESEKLSDKELAKLYWNKYVKVDDSFIVDLFVGQLKSTLCCNKCGYRSITFDPFWDLSLPIPKINRNPISLTDCLNLFTSEEILDGDEMPKCFKCKMKRPCTKRFSIHKFPSVLVIHLKRFSGDRYRSKISSFIEFPTKNLNLQNYGEPLTFASYNLYAVSNHSGTVDGGHYTAYCCNPSSKIWYKYDDTRVYKVNENNVCSSEAYVLFYQLIDKNVHFSR